MKKVKMVVLIGMAVISIVYASSGNDTETNEKQKQKELMEATMRTYGVTQQDLADFFVMAGALEGSSKTEKMTTPKKNKMLVEVAIGAINEGDWELMAKLYSPKYVQHGPGDPKTITWSEAELICRVIRQKVPTLRYEIEDIIAEGEKVAVRLKTVVTFKETYQHGTRGGGKVEFMEIDIIRIEDGRIVEEWCEYDLKDWDRKFEKLQYVKTWR